MDQKRTEKHEEARNSLPEKLRGEFDKLVAEYKYIAAIRHGAPYVSYFVLADLIRAGWRCIESERMDDKT